MNPGVPRRDPSVREMEIDGEITLFHTETQTALVLNETASDVWRLIDGERGDAEITDVLTRVYEADAETVRAGIRSAMAQLESHGLLEAGR